MFAVVYFAQGMWSLPQQPMTFVLKERFGYSATRVATLTSLMMVPWLIKPLSGLTADGQQARGAVTPRVIAGLLTVFWAVWFSIVSATNALGWRARPRVPRPARLLAGHPAPCGLASVTGAVERLIRVAWLPLIQSEREEVPRWTGSTDLRGVDAIRRATRSLPGELSGSMFPPMLK